MSPYMTVKEAAEQLNIPVEVLQSWIEQGIIHEEEAGIPRDRFLEQLESPEVKRAFAIFKQATLGSEEE